MDNLSGNLIWLFSIFKPISKIIYNFPKPSKISTFIFYASSTRLLGTIIAD